MVLSYKNNPAVITEDRIEKSTSPYTALTEHAATRQAALPKIKLMVVEWNAHLEKMQQIHHLAEENDIGYYLKLEGSEKKEGADA